jgi:dicarboxylate/amino acid:cation (Na+ or H+) symporter, DAACS family
MEPPSGERRGIPLHSKILVGLVLGATAGVVANATARGTPQLEWIVANVAQPIGQIFLRLLFMVVVPLVFTSIALGVAQLGDLRRIGRIGAKTLGFFVVTTTLAVVIGLVMANVVRPGEAIDEGTRSALLEKYGGQAAEKQSAAISSGFGIGTFVAIVPRNPVDAAAKGDMLGLIFFALVFGVALTRLETETAKPVIRVLDGIAKAVEIMIGFAMQLAPLGVFALIFSVTATFGIEVLKSLGLYVLMVLGGLAIHQFGVIGVLARLLGGISPLSFFRRARGLMITAFSTSSSNATLPTNIRTAEQEFGVPSQIAGFVLPLGATMNMNGTALFEGMTVLFLAQVFGIELSLGSQAVVVVMAVLTAIGAAGVPSGSIPLLVMVLEMVGVPGTGIALILGVDRILDMARTVPNVTSDLLASIVITRSEGLPFVIPEQTEPDLAPGPTPEERRMAQGQ